MTDPQTVPHPKPVDFTIDGKSFIVDDPKQTASALLKLAGLDPANYDLAAIRPDGAEPKRFRADETVHVKDDEEFVTIRHSAPVE